MKIICVTIFTDCMGSHLNGKSQINLPKYRTDTSTNTPTHMLTHTQIQAHKHMQARAIEQNVITGIYLK